MWPYQLVLHTGKNVNSTLLFSKPLIGVTSESPGHMISTSPVAGAVIHIARMKATDFPFEVVRATRVEGVKTKVNVSPRPEPIEALPNDTQLRAVQN